MVWSRWRRRRIDFLSSLRNLSYAVEFASQAGSGELNLPGVRGFSRISGSSNYLRLFPNNPEGRVYRYVESCGEEKEAFAGEMFSGEPPAVVAGWNFSGLGGGGANREAAGGKAADY